MRVISKSNASSLPIGGTEYVPGPDGVYDVPEPLGVELTTRHASMWVSEAAHVSAVVAAEIERLRDPRVMPRVVAELLARVATLEAKLADRTKPQAPKAETAPAEEPKPEEPKLTAAQKRAAAKAAKAETSADQEPGASGE